MKALINCPWLFSLGSMGMLLAGVSQAALVSDSTVTLTSRNFYLDRDYKGETPYAAAREWAQGFILRAQSGYTEGAVGFGLDLTGMVGLKLDSSPDRTGTQLIEFNPVTRKTRDEYSELGTTLKAKVSKTRLLLGTQFPVCPSSRPVRHDCCHNPSGACICSPRMYPIQHCTLGAWTGSINGTPRTTSPSTLPLPMGVSHRAPARHSSTFWVVTIDGHPA